MQHAVAVPMVVAVLVALGIPSLRSQDDRRLDAAAQWGQWRGPARDGLSQDTGLLERWPAGGPPLEWKTTGLGQGFSSVSIFGDRIYTMGDSRGAARLFALDAAGGRILWSTRVGAAGGERNAGPRSTPATDGRVVVALGQDGALVCADAGSGDVRWRRNLRLDFRGTMMSGWGYSESPLLDGDRVVCTPGGSRGAVVALDRDTGEVLWRCTGLRDPAAYASIVPADIGGVRQYIVLTGESVAGIAARTGELLWRAPRRGQTAVCSTPVFADGIVFVSSDYGIGCNAFRITSSGDGFRATQIHAGRQLMSHHGGFVLVDGYVYGVGRRNLKCIELATGEVMWENLCVGKGSVAYADGDLIVRSERGRAEIALVEATPRGYVEKGRFAQPDRTSEPSWAHPVVFGGRLYVRDQGLLLCFDLRQS